MVKQIGVDASTTLVVGGRDEERFSAVTVEPPKGRLPQRMRGRDELLETLWTAADAPGGRVHVLAGIGGIGKTAVALAAAERARRAGRSVWWVRGDRFSLPADLLEVVRQLGASRYELEEARSGRRSVPMLVWQYLREAEPRWVLVIDGADEPEALAAEGRSLGDGGGWIQPGGPGLVVVTSRHTASETWGQGTCVHPIRPLEAADAAVMLLDLAPEAGTATEARDLAGRLGGIPLALHLAGRYLAWPLASHRTFSSYRGALDSQFAATVDAAALVQSGRPDPRDLVMTTWEISLDTLDIKGVPQARPMLRRISFYASAVPIPRRLLEIGAAIDHEHTGATGTDARIALEQGLNALISLGLVEMQALTTGSRQLPEQGIVIHPLVAETNRAHSAASPATDSYPLLEAILQLAELINKLPGDDPGYWPHWQILAPHISALLHHLPSTTPGISASVLNGAGAVVAALIRGGALAEAEHLCDVSLQCARLLDSAHTAIPVFTYHRALVLAERGSLKEAETETRSALDMRRETPGEDADGVLACRKLLASILHQRGHLATAEDECRAVLRAMCARSGPDAPETLATRIDLALILHGRGRLDDAEREIRTVLDAERRVQGEDHPDTLAALHNLALIRASRGDLKQAERLFRTVLKTRWQILGGDHPHTLSTWHLHTQTWWQIEASDEAADEMARVAQALRDALGEEHPVTMNARQDLATMRHQQGRLPEAAAEARAVVETSRRKLGERHPGTLRARSNLGAITSIGRPARTLADLQAILLEAQQVLGGNHSVTLMIRQNIAGILHSQREFRQAEHEFQAILEIQRRVLGRHHPDTLTTRLNHVVTLASLGELKAAENEACEILRVACRTLDKGHPFLRDVQELLTEIRHRKM